jgi:hypothetical protein
MREMILKIQSENLPCSKKMANTFLQIQQTCTKLPKRTLQTPEQTVERTNRKLRHGDVKMFKRKLRLRTLESGEKQLQLNIEGSRTTI